MYEEKHMLRALELAREAAKLDEVPVGAVVVDSAAGKVIAEAHNQSEHSGNACDHAEILALRRACERLGVSRLRGCDLYVTLEPCTMCAAAISFARIENLYFGATDVKGGAVISGVQFYEASTCHHRPLVHHGLAAEESSQLLKSFFRSKRRGSPAGKTAK